MKQIQINIDIQKNHNFFNFNIDKELINDIFLTNDEEWYQEILMFIVTMKFINKFVQV